MLKAPLWCLFQNVKIVNEKKDLNALLKNIAAL